MLRGSQGLTRGAQGRQTGATEAAWRRLWAPWGLPGEALGPPWEAPRDNFGAKIDPKLDDFAASVFESVLLKFFSDSYVLLFSPTLRIYSDFQLNLQVFRFGQFQEHV